MYDLHEIEADWHRIGIHLGVPQCELKKVDKEQSEISRKFVDVLQYWLDNEQYPSWDKIVSALKKIQCTNLADNLHSKYCDNQEPPK